MKRIVYFLSILVSVFTVNAQTYERLSEEEIAASESYKAVAYNFVYAFINRDTDKLKELIDSTAYNHVFGGDDGVKAILQSNNIHDIADMRHIISLGYYPVVTLCNELDLSPYFNHFNPYVGCEAMNVRFDCVSANGEFFSRNLGDFDSDVRVMLVFVNNKWRIVGFK